MATAGWNDNEYSCGRFLESVTLRDPLAVRPNTNAHVPYLSLQLTAGKLQKYLADGCDLMVSPSSRSQSTTDFHRKCGKGKGQTFCSERCSDMEEAAVAAAAATTMAKGTGMGTGTDTGTDTDTNATRSALRPPSTSGVLPPPQPTERKCVEPECTASALCAMTCAACDGGLHKGCGSAKPGRCSKEDSEGPRWCTACTSRYTGKGHVGQRPERDPAAEPSS